jgi:hypothetical protein
MVCVAMVKGIDGVAVFEAVCSVLSVGVWFVGFRLQ